MNNINNCPFCFIPMNGFYQCKKCMYRLLSFVEYYYVSDDTTIVNYFKENKTYILQNGSSSLTIKKSIKLNKENVEKLLLLI